MKVVVMQQEKELTVHLNFVKCQFEWFVVRSIYAYCRNTSNKPEPEVIIIWFINSIVSFNKLSARNFSFTLGKLSLCKSVFRVQPLVKTSFNKKLKKLVILILEKCFLLKLSNNRRMTYWKSCKLTADMGVWGHRWGRKMHMSNFQNVWNKNVEYLLKRPLHRTECRGLNKPGFFLLRRTKNPNKPSRSKY